MTREQPGLARATTTAETTHGLRQIDLRRTGLEPTQDFFGTRLQQADPRSGLLFNRPISELLKLFGGKPESVATLSWMIGISLAGLGGILRAAPRC